MLPSEMVFILNFFDICGFNSGSSKLSETQKIAYLIYFVHISMATILTFYEFCLVDDYYSLLGLSEAISESVQYSTALYTYWLIIFDSIVHRRAHKHFWIVLQRIDTSFSCQPIRSIRIYIVKIVIFSMKTVLVMVIRLTIGTMVGLTIDFAYITLFVICEIRIFYYLLCLEVLHFQLKVVENEVKIMMTILNVSNFRKHQSACYSFELERLKWIRGYIHCVYKMMDLLNQIFGWSHVAGISFCFYYLLTESNWLYIHFRELSHIHRFRKYSIDFIQCERIYFIANKHFFSCAAYDCTLAAVNILFIP